MLISFYVSRNDLDQLEKLENHAIKNILWKMKDTYNIDVISSIADSDVEAIKKWFVQVSIDYSVYIKIKEYLNFELFERYKR